MMTQNKQVGAIDCEWNAENKQRTENEKDKFCVERNKTFSLA
jgi:hypothetical protein